MGKPQQMGVFTKQKRYPLCCEEGILRFYV